jgi:hypothetical protein
MSNEVFGFWTSAGGLSSHLLGWLTGLPPGSLTCLRFCPTIRRWSSRFEPSSAPAPRADRNFTS